MNGHSLLGVKLSEAQSYLVKSSDQVHMVVCDGFNVAADSSSASLTPLTSMSPSSSLPFPTANSSSSSSSTPVPPPVTLPKPVFNVQNATNGHTGSGADRTDFSGLNGNRFSRSSIPSTPTTTMNAQCNYDNLRDIEGATEDYTTVAQLNAANGNGVKPPPPPPTSSLPITDKNLMNNIMNKTSGSGFDPKSQSMFTANNNQNNQGSVRIYCLFFSYVFRNYGCSYRILRKLE